MQGVYTITAGENLIKEYTQKNGDLWQFSGCLADSYICKAAGFKYAIIKEKYLNEWSSGYKIRFCRKLSKGLQKAVEMIEAAETDDEEQKAINQFYKFA